MVSPKYGEMNDSLTKRETQIAELISWGASKKEVPGMLRKIYGGREISVHTVENTLRNIFGKLGLTKSTELGAWWFCSKYGIDASESPFARLRKTVIAVFFLVIMFPHICHSDSSAVRLHRTRTTRTERVQRKKD